MLVWRRVGMLAAASRGAFAKRRAAKARGDELVSRGDFGGAATAYSEALGAVLQVGDSAALVIEAPLQQVGGLVPATQAA
jgi:hypothetical protein